MCVGKTCVEFICEANISAPVFYLTSGSSCGCDCPSMTVTLTMCSPSSRCSVVPHAYENPQEAEALLQTTAGRTWGRVHAQRIHHTPATEGAFRSAEPERPTGQDLVSKPSYEEKKTVASRAGIVILLEKKDALKMAGEMKEARGSSWWGLFTPTVRNVTLVDILFSYFNWLIAWF